MPVPVLLALLALTACGPPAVVPMDKGVYLVNVRNPQLGYGAPEGAKTEAYQAASEFCAAKGLVVETVSLQMTDSEYGRPGSVSLQFRCVPPPKPGEENAHLTRAEAEKKLEDLKALQAKGLISREDFERKKKDILDRM
jgi:hypothetical protein